MEHPAFARASSCRPIARCSSDVTSLRYSTRTPTPCRYSPQAQRPARAGLQNTHRSSSPNRTCSRPPESTASTLAQAIRCQPLTRPVPGEGGAAAIAAPAVARTLQARRRTPDVSRTVQAEQAPIRSRVTLSTSANGSASQGASRLASPALRHRLDPAGAGASPGRTSGAGLGRNARSVPTRGPSPSSGASTTISARRGCTPTLVTVWSTRPAASTISATSTRGGSVFPTSGAANPTLTIVALGAAARRRTEARARRTLTDWAGPSAWLACRI